MGSTDLKEMFRQSMRRLASTVSVITCASGDRWYGITATAVTSLCAEPASVLVCINQSSSIISPLLSERAFYVNLLNSSHVDISQNFGGRVKGNERFHEGIWKAGERGMPYLCDAQANLFCRVDGDLTYGTHKIIIGRVEGGRFATEVKPLIYQNGGYAATSRILRERTEACQLPSPWLEVFL